MQKIQWQTIANVGTPAFGVSVRARVPKGWLVANKAGPSTAASKTMVFVPDEANSWTVAELKWELVADVSGNKTIGTTYRAKVPGGYLIGNVIGTTTSSRTLNYIEGDSTWLEDPVEPPPPPPPPPPSGGVFFVGHSLVNHTMPNMFEAIGASLNVAGSTTNEHIINGAPLSWNWNHHAEAEGGSANDATVQLPTGKYTSLVLTERVDIQACIQWEDTVGNFRKFADLIYTAHPTAQVYMYETWTDRVDHATWKAKVASDRTHFVHVLDTVSAAQPTRKPILLVPAGKALVALVDRVMAGTATGITNPTQIFSDNIHMTDLGNYFVALVHFATVFKRSPVGAGTAGSIPAATAAFLQQLAWDIVSTDPKAGIGATNPDPIPDPDPIPTPSTKWIGTNLNGVNDWSTEFAFKDHMKKSRRPFSSTSSTWSDGRPLSLDARGNVLSLEPGQIARTVVFTADRPVVDYVLSWEGQGTINAVSSFTVISSTSNSMVIRPKTSSANAWIDITSTNASNPLRNMSLVRVDQQNVAGMFNPDFLNDIKRYACLRFMDWQNTNSLRSNLAEDFAALNALPITYAERSVPVEVMIQLCNEANVDAWFCIPINADAAYIDRFLNLVKDKLNPGLKARIELSNEVWNSIFPQHTAVGGANFDERMLNYASKAADLGVRTKAILGARGISVFGAHAVNTWWMNRSLTHIQSLGKPLPEVLSTAPYFSGADDDVNAFTDGRVDNSIASMVKYTQDAVALAKRLGMRVELYEAGQHCVPGINMNRDPRMGTAYEKYLGEMKNVLEGGLLCHFAYVSRYSQHGSWGEKEYQYAPDSPKSAAIKKLQGIT